MKITDRFIDKNIFICDGENVYLMKQHKRFNSRKDYYIVYCRNEDFYTETHYVNPELTKVLSFSYSQMELDKRHEHNSLINFRIMFFTSHGVRHLYGVHSICYPRKIFKKFLEKRFRK